MQDGAPVISYTPEGGPFRPSVIPRNEPRAGRSVLDAQSVSATEWASPLMLRQAQHEG